MADVEEWGPATWAAGLVGISGPVATEDETCPWVLLDLRARGQQCFCSAPPAVGRGEDERLRVSLGCEDERGPIQIAGLARQRQLRVRERDAFADGCVGADAMACSSPTRAARASSFACLRSCSRFTATSFRFTRRPRVRAGKKIVSGVLLPVEVGSALPADWVRPRSRASNDSRAEDIRYARPFAFSARG